MSEQSPEMAAAVERVMLASRAIPGVYGQRRMIAQEFEAALAAALRLARLEALREAASIMRKSGCADHAWLIENLPELRQEMPATGSQAR